MSSTAASSPLYLLTDLENGHGEDQRVGGITPGTSHQSSLPTSPTEITHMNAITGNPGTPSDPRQPATRASLRFLPRKLRDAYGKASGWIKGPQPPRPHRIQGVWEFGQTAPLRLFDCVAPNFTLKVILIINYYVFWLCLFLSLLEDSTSSEAIGSYGPPVRLSCTSRLWANTTQCGVDGEHCRPFEKRDFSFRCPSGCRDVMVLNPYTVGNEEVIYRSLVIGGLTDQRDPGSAVYRGDSFLCAAAIHAGAIENHRGGLGIISALGESHTFVGAERNAIKSISFNSSFPLSFTFLQVQPSVQDLLSRHPDPRWRLLITSCIFTLVVSLLTTSGSVLFASVYVSVFFQVALASDPPDVGGFDSVVSAAFGRFLPAAFVGFGIYLTSARRTLFNLKASFEKAFLWLGGCWIGALSNETLRTIPIQRLTPHDLKQQPGAITALSIILVLLLLAIIRQALDLWAEGRLRQYLLLYLALGLSVSLLLAIPGQELRIHHYILALLLLPGTSMQTRWSLLFQGLLVGLFINGVARWGFASILQTPSALLEDRLIRSPVPEVPFPVINPSNITFAWDTLVEGFSGISVRVNDVERYRGFSDRDDVSFTWRRSGPGLDDYFRFAFVSYGRLSGPWVADYSKAGVWRSDGQWVPISQ